MITFVEDFFFTSAREYARLFERGPLVQLLGDDLTTPELRTILLQKLASSPPPGGASLYCDWSKMKEPEPESSEAKLRDALLSFPTAKHLDSLASGSEDSASPPPQKRRYTRRALSDWIKSAITSLKDSANSEVTSIQTLFGSDKINARYLFIDNFRQPDDDQEIDNLTKTMVFYLFSIAKMPDYQVMNLRIIINSDKQSTIDQFTHVSLFFGFTGLAADINAHIIKTENERSDLKKKFDEKAQVIQELSSNIEGLESLIKDKDKTNRRLHDDIDELRKTEKRLTDEKVVLHGRNMNLSVELSKRTEGENFRQRLDDVYTLVNSTAMQATSIESIVKNRLEAAAATTSPMGTWTLAAVSNRLGQLIQHVEYHLPPPANKGSSGPSSSHLFGYLDALLGVTGGIPNAIRQSNREILQLLGSSSEPTTLWGDLTRRVGDPKPFASLFLHFAAVAGKVDKFETETTAALRTISDKIGERTVNATDLGAGVSQAKSLSLHDAVLTAQAELDARIGTPKEPSKPDPSVVDMLAINRAASDARLTLLIRLAVAILIVLGLLMATSLGIAWKCFTVSKSPSANSASHQSAQPPSASPAPSTEAARAPPESQGKAAPQTPHRASSQPSPAAQKRGSSAAPPQARNQPAETAPAPMPDRYPTAEELVRLFPKSGEAPSAQLIADTLLHQGKEALKLDPTLCARSRRLPARRICRGLAPQKRCAVVIHQDGLEAFPSSGPEVRVQRELLGAGFFDEIYKDIQEVRAPRASEIDASNLFYLKKSDSKCVRLWISANSYRLIACRVIAMSPETTKQASALGCPNVPVEPDTPKPTLSQSSAMSSGQSTPHNSWSMR